jgi:hypothetical protein
MNIDAAMKAAPEKNKPSWRKFRDRGDCGERMLSAGRLSTASGEACDIF